LPPIVTRLLLLRKLPGNRERPGQLAWLDASRHTIHMKRTNLVLDAALLEEATRLSGEKTYSAAVQRALRDFVQRAKARQSSGARGLWEGELSQMRRDQPSRRGRRRVS
jgi:Arc/MetJ family transcription regulator